MTARGIRNNNPGNIRHSTAKWDGLTKDQTDSEFCTFTDMKYGCRALMKLLHTYVTSNKLNTIRSIITRYAPSNENNTNAYIKSVCKTMNVNPDEKLNFSIYNSYLLLAKAIVKHECGKDAQTINDSTWKDAYYLFIK